MIIVYAQSTANPAHQGSGKYPADGAQWAVTCGYATIVDWTAKPAPGIGYRIA